MASATPLAFFLASSSARLKSVAFVEGWAMAFPLAVKVAGIVNARVPIRFGGVELFSLRAPARGRIRARGECRAASSGSRLPVQASPGDPQTSFADLHALRQALTAARRAS